MRSRDGTPFHCCVWSYTKNFCHYLYICKCSQSDKYFCMLKLFNPFYLKWNFVGRQLYVLMYLTFLKLFYWLTVFNVQNLFVSLLSRIIVSVLIWHKYVLSLKLCFSFGVNYSGIYCTVFSLFAATLKPPLTICPATQSIIAISVQL